MTQQNPSPSHLTLLHTLKEHTSIVSSVAWSPNGRVLASGSKDKTIRLWDGETSHLLRVFEGYMGIVYSVAWSPDGSMLACGSQYGAIRLWGGQTEQPLRTPERDYMDNIHSVAWSADGCVLAAGSGSIYNTLFLWNGQTEQPLYSLQGHTSAVYSVAWSPKKRVLASGSEDKTICLWDDEETDQPPRTLKGHTGYVYSVVWSPDGNMLASGSKDSTIRLWDGETGQLLRVLEGHTAGITCISFSYDGRLLASKSLDDTVRLWNIDSGETVEILEERSSKFAVFGVAFHPHAPILATLGEKDTVVRIWEVDADALLGVAPTTRSVHYTTAKIALVGESGVGKSGLGHRIVTGEYKEFDSTYGQEFWVMKVVDALGGQRQDGTLCEAVLWDFAGQSIFRPIHALFLDDVDLALVLFDASRSDTLKGVDYWLKQLAHKEGLCRTVLVAARTDVSPLSLSLAELKEFCSERKISAFVATSAKKDKGIDRLLEVVRQKIDWDAKPTTITTQTFKRVKDYVLGLKAAAELTEVLVSPAQLRLLLEATDADWRFSDAEMLTAVEHLENHGYVTILRRSSDEQSILLVPNLLNNLAANYILEAQSNEKGLGALEEARALRNKYKFPVVEGLSGDERETLLHAVTELFLKRNICFRESVDNQTFLVFPGLILERPPRLIEDAQVVEDVTYLVTGPVENVYAALVVLLGYAPDFQRVNQWRKQAQYETARGEVCGFKLANDELGELELVLYYGKETPEFVRSRFQGLFEEILHTRKVTVKKYAPIICPKCQRQQERRTVMRLMAEGEAFLFCARDGTKIDLVQEPERVVLSHEDRAVVARDQALIQMRTMYETALSSVKRFVHDRGQQVAPTCFISYAWGDSTQTHWVQGLADDLRKADLGVVLDQWDNAAIGASIARFISRIEECDFILAIGTPGYRRKYENTVSPAGSVVAAEVDLMNRRLLGTEAEKASILPLLLDGEARTSFPPLLQGRVWADFRGEERYLAALFDLVLTLYGIPFGDALVRDLRERLRQEEEDPFILRR